MENKEIWDLYDKDGKFVCKFVRGEGAIPPQLYHKTVEVIPTDMEGSLLLTRRSNNKKLGGGLLEFPAGSVISGEREQDAAVRELEEETGLRPAKLYLLQKARSKGIIRYTFLAYIPHMTQKNVIYAPEEVMEHLFCTYDQWTALLTSGEYNGYRLRAYNEELFRHVKDLVNRHANNETKPQQHKPLQPNSALATKKPRYLDPRCYEATVTTPPGYEDREPGIEQGDDGT